jgi:hypothetical protein
VLEVAASVVGGSRAQDSILDLVIAGSDVLELHAGRGLGDSLRALCFLAEAVATPDASMIIGEIESKLAALKEMMAPEMESE